MATHTGILPPAKDAACSGALTTIWHISETWSSICEGQPGEEDWPSQPRENLVTFTLPQPHPQTRDLEQVDTLPVWLLLQPGSAL